MTQQDFVDWQRHPMTMSLFTSLHNMIQDGREELGRTAGLDSLSDRFKVGMLKAYEDVLELTFEEVSNDSSV